VSDVLHIEEEADLNVTVQDVLRYARAIDDKAEENHERILKMQAEIDRLKKAVETLSSYVDAALWRMASWEERRDGIKVRDEVRRILEGKVLAR